MIKLKDVLRKVLKEFTGVNFGTGLNIGDSWPDGLFTKYGEYPIQCTQLVHANLSISTRKKSESKR